MVRFGYREIGCPDGGLDARVGGQGDRHRRRDEGYERQAGERGLDAHAVGNHAAEIRGYADAVQSFVREGKEEAFGAASR